MHGRLKVKTTEEQKQLQKKEKENQINAFLVLRNKILDCRKNNIKDIDTLKLLSECVLKAPEWNLLWNYRREILIELKYPEEMMDVELTLTSNSLKGNPKAYAAWYHRSWVMEKHPKPNWDKEIEMCNYALDLDERNFHCWDYRRFIVNSGKIPKSDEFDYTDKQIYKNISNYSSWHYRSSILDEGSVTNDLKHELELINNAIFTDPSDQSPWFYLRWLMLYNRKKPFMRELYVNRRMKMLILIVSEPVVKNFIEKVDINVTMTTSLNKTFTIWDSTKSKQLPWNRVLGGSMSSVWTLSLGDEINAEDDVRVVIKHHEKCDFRWECDMKPNQSESLVRTDTDINRILCDNISEEVPMEIVEEELKVIQELYSMEHDNKWVLLTIVSLLRILSPIESKVEILDKLSQLKQIDPLRTQFYNDAQSKLHIECELIELYNSHKRSVNLSHKSLSLIAHLDWMPLMTSLDLSHNLLTHLPSEFRYLLCLEHLDLSHNCLPGDDNDVLSPLKHLPSMQKLTLSHNQLTTFQQLEPALYCPRLFQINIRANPVALLPNLTDLICTHPASKTHSVSIALLR